MSNEHGQMPAVDLPDTTISEETDAYFAELREQCGPRFVCFGDERALMSLPEVAKIIRERDEARRDLVSAWLEMSTERTTWENIARANGWGYLCREDGE